MEIITHTEVNITLQQYTPLFSHLPYYICKPKNAQSKSSSSWPVILGPALSGAALTFPVADSSLLLMIWGFWWSHSWKLSGFFCSAFSLLKEPGTFLTFLRIVKQGLFELHVCYFWKVPTEFIEVTNKLKLDWFDLSSISCIRHTYGSSPASSLYSLRWIIIYPWP